MKIDRDKVAKSPYPLPPKVKTLISKLASCLNDDELDAVLTTVVDWKLHHVDESDLFYWIDVFNKFDAFLEDCCKRAASSDDVTAQFGPLAIDLPENSKKKTVLLKFIHFMSLLTMGTYGKSTFSSQEHLAALLVSTDIEVVAAVMEFLSLHSNSLMIKTEEILGRIKPLTGHWGGASCGVSLAHCCNDVSISNFPAGATELNFEANKKPPGSAPIRIRIPNMHLDKRPLVEVMSELVKHHQIPSDAWFDLFAKIRLIRNFANFEGRLHCVLVRIYAIAHLASTRSISLQVTEELTKELVKVLSVASNSKLMEKIKTASLDALPFLMCCDGSEATLRMIIKETEASEFDGCLPMLARDVIDEMIATQSPPTPLEFSLTNLLYKMAYWPIGSEALFQANLTESLFQLIKWKGSTTAHLKTINMAVAIVEYIAQHDAKSYHCHNGLGIMTRRIVREVDACRFMAPFDIEIDRQSGLLKPCEETDPELRCLPRRVNLLYLCLVSLKQSVGRKILSDSMRQVMGRLELSSALQHIISNGHYYGGPVFSQALAYLTAYTHHSPIYLSTMIDCGLFDAILYALLAKPFPCSKSVLAALPGIFDVLCLNHPGMKAFTAKKPFEKIFKLFTSAKYLVEVRETRDEVLGDAMTEMGRAMEDFIRRHNGLQDDAIRAIVVVLVELRRLGQDQKYICSKISDTVEDDFDDHTIEEFPEIDVNYLLARLYSNQNPFEADDKKDVRIPLHHYIFLTTKFLDAWMGASSGDSLRNSFLAAKGLGTMLDLLKSPILSPDSFSASKAFDSMCNFYVSFQTPAVETAQGKLLAEMDRFSSLCDQVERCSDGEGGSTLLKELVLHLSSCSPVNLVHVVTPTRRSLTVVDCLVKMLNRHCLTSKSSDDKMAAVLKQWAAPQSGGLKVIRQLAQLYAVMLWEKSILEELVEPPSRELKCKAIQTQLDQIVQLAKKVAQRRAEQKKGDSVKEEDLSDPAVICRKFVCPIAKMTQKFTTTFKQLLCSFADMATMSFKSPNEHQAAICQAVISALHTALSHQPPPGTDSPMHRAKWYISLLKTLNLALSDKHRPTLLGMERGRIIAPFFAMFEKMASANNLQNDTWPWKILQFVQNWLALLEKMANPRGLKLKEFLIGLHMRAYDSISVLFTGNLIKQYNSSHLDSLFALLAHLFKFHADVTRPYLMAVEGSQNNSASDSHVPGREGFSFELPDLREPSTSPPVAALSSSQLHILAVNVTQEIISLLEVHPLMLAKCGDLLLLIDEFKDSNQKSTDFLDSLAQNVTQAANSLVKLISETTAPKDGNDLHSVTAKFNLSVRLFLTLFARQSSQCALVTRKHNLMASLQSLLEQATSSCRDVPTWLSPVLLLIDQFERHVVAHRLRARILADHPKRQWKIRQDKQWTNVGSTIDSKIDQAFVEGKPYCRYELGSHHYTAHFGTMTSFCDEMRKAFPITVMPANSTDSPLFQLHELLQVRESSSLPHATDQYLPPESCFDNQPEWLLRVVVNCLKLPAINKDTLEAILRVALRVTQTHSNACRFAELGGVHILLDLHRDVEFCGLFQLTMMLIRHVFEDDSILREAMSNNIKWETQKTTDFDQQATLRRIGSAAYRGMDLFAELIQSMLKAKGDEFLPSGRSSEPAKKIQPCKEAAELVTHLLNLLPKRFTYEVGSKWGDKGYSFGTSTLLCILAELCRFCDSTADIILQHSYSSGHAECITTNCTAVDFIFNHLLYVPSGAGPFSTAETPIYCGVLCKFAIRADEQKSVTCLLFQKIDHLLEETLQSAESVDKHRKIEGICNLLKISVQFACVPSKQCKALQFIEQCGLLERLALAVGRLYFPSPSLSISVNALVSVLLCIVNMIFKAEETEAPPGAQPTQSAPVTPAPVDDDDDDDEVRAPPPVQEVDEMTGPASSSNSADNFQVCPLVHPLLLSGQSPPSNITDSTLHFKTCQPLLKNPEPLFQCPVSHYSCPRANSVIIFHGFNSTTGNSSHISGRIIPCSICRWYQEGAMLDGDTMSFKAVVAAAEVKANWKCEEETRANQGSPSTEQSTTKVKEEAAAPKGESHKEVPLLELKKLAGPSTSGKDAKQVKELQKEAPLPVKEAATGQRQLTPQQRAIIGDGPLPEGVDMDMLLELPEDLLREFLEEHRKTAPVETRQEQVKQAAAPTANPIDPVTLANTLNEALAVATALAQVVNQPAPSPPPQPAPVNEAAQVVHFVQSLPPPLRREILMEMDDTQLRLMPDDIVAEVRVLRQEAARRINDQENAEEQEEENAARPRAQASAASRTPLPTSPPPRPGRELLSRVAFRSLMELLFLQNDSIQWSSYHSLMVSLCRNPSLRKWIIDQLLLIQEAFEECPKDVSKLYAGASFFINPTGIKTATVKSAFGAQVPVLLVEYFKDEEDYDEHYNPQAEELVLINVDELMIALGGTYPDFYFPPDDVDPGPSNESPSPQAKKD